MRVRRSSPHFHYLRGDFYTCLSDVVCIKFLNVGGVLHYGVIWPHMVPISSNIVLVPVSVVHEIHAAIIEPGEEGGGFAVRGVRHEPTGFAATATATAAGAPAS
ncbi:hypothetical protein BHM03_00039821, partial [Ensete ventricosum]